MKSKGFTLIELLVVVAIISLLSSVVLASVKDARDKAKTQALKASISQFVNALELYRSDNGGLYPGQPNDPFYYLATRTSNGTLSYSETPSGYGFSSKLSPYIKKFPEPIQLNTNWFYYSYTSQSFKCEGDVNVPPYVILVSSTEPGFSNWPYFQSSSGVSTSYRCFSLK